MPSTSRFRTLALAALSYIVFVILWGAFVRASGSGAGCGAHWPLCNGQVLPPSPTVETIIEFGHRITSGLSLVIVGAVVWVAFKTFAKGHPARKMSVVSMALLLAEALIGAGLVLLELVAHDDSVLRAVAVAGHLVNTFLLVGALAATVYAGKLDKEARALLANVIPNGQKWLLGIGAVSFLVVGASGAVVALGDTLFPASSLAEGVAQDFAPAAHFLIRLRVYHPAFAVMTAIYMLCMCGALRRRDPSHEVRAWASTTTFIVGLQIALGVANFLLRAPTWLQLVHLLVADVLWVSLVFLGLHALAAPSPRPVTAAEPASSRRSTLARQAT